jgi:hypothetical protein
MAQWLADYRQHIKRYTQYAGKSTFRKTLLLLATEQGLWALFQYRVSAAAGIVYMLRWGWSGLTLVLSAH